MKNSIIIGALFIFVLLAGINFVYSNEIGCLDTTFKFLSPDDSVCVSAFEDQKVQGVTCHISQARKGGWSSFVGLAEDPSRFSIACRQTGPITLPKKLPKQESVFSERTSAFFKNTKVIRMYDKKHNTLIYLAVSKKIIEGSPQNALSTVPIMPWGQQR